MEEKQTQIERLLILQNIIWSLCSASDRVDEARGYLENSREVISETLNEKQNNRFSDIMNSLWNVRSLIGKFCLDIMPEFDSLVKVYKDKELKDKE
jgi:hypothetical protein